MRGIGPQVPYLGCTVWYPTKPGGRAIVRRPNGTGYAVANDGTVTEYDEQGREVPDGG